MAAPVLQLKRGLLANLPGLRAGEPGFTTDSYDLYVGIDSTTTNNKFFGSHRYWTRGTATSGSGVNLVEATNNGTQYITLKSPDSLAGIVTYTLPGIQGAPTSVLTNDGSGGLTWASGSNNATFTGITTFSDLTDNTLGNADTGSVQIDGGVGINKNLTVGANLNVQGYSEFVGVVTFRGGTINLGDASGDNITVGGRFASNLTPNLDNTYDVGISTLNWRNAHFSGIGTFETGAVIDGVQIGINGANIIDTVSGNLTLNSAGGTTIIDDYVNIQNNLNVSGNVTIGGTTVVFTGQDVFIQNKDIVLGYTTNTSNADASTDITANHGGVAVASTEGTPLANFNASGINTLPSTYKQMMWFKSGTLGFSTDAFAFNYGVAIGTTTMGDKVRLAVGSGITMSDTSIKATTFYGDLVGNVSSADQVKTVTASDTNANYYVTFVNSHNGSATNETVYTDDGIYYNPGANKLTTQHAEFTGNVLVSGITTLAGNVNLGDSGSDIITVVGLTTFTTSNVYINNQLFVGGLQVSGGAVVGQDITTRHLAVSGISTFTGAVNLNGNVTLGDNPADAITINGNAIFTEPIVGTISTATRATLIDTTNTTNNSDYYATFVDTLAGQNSETLRVGLGVSVNPSNGDVKTTGKLSVGNPGALTSYIRAGGGSDALYLYGNGDVSFQAKAIVNEIRSSSNASTLITLSDLDATFARNVTVSGIATVSNNLTVGGDIRVNGNDIQASDGSTNITLTSNTLTTFAGDIKVAGNDIQASDGNANITMTSNTLTAFAGDIRVNGNDIQSSTGANVITLATNNATFANDVTVNGNLYVSGNTTQVNTAALTVEDRTIDLGIVNGATPSANTTWDLGVLFNYYTGGAAKKSAVIWEHGDSRFKFASVLGSDTDGTDANTPQLTVTTFAPIEISELWVNTSCTSNTSTRVVGCTGSALILENITVDGGSF